VVSMHLYAGIPIGILSGVSNIRPPNIAQIVRIVLAGSTPPAHSAGHSLFCSCTILTALPMRHRALMTE
jgi:hypothetical protein